MIIPGVVTDSVGITFLALAFFWQRTNKDKGPVVNHGEDI